MTKVQSHMMLVLHNVRMVPSNVRKKKGTTKYDKSTVICDVGTIKYKKINKGTTEYDKSTVTCDIGIAQCENDTIKCEKTIREPLNVRKVQSHVILVLHNVKMVSLNVKK